MSVSYTIILIIVLSAALLSIIGMVLLSCITLIIRTCVQLYTEKRELNRRRNKLEIEVNRDQTVYTTAQ